jgi:hypothetical protein
VQIKKANKARKAALLKNPEYQLFEERKQFRRQAASKQRERSENANKVRQAAPPNNPDCPPCDERRRPGNEGIMQEMERDS